MSDRFLQIDGLVKRFGPFTAVDNLSFNVNKGEVLGFLGPNGAGKSTTMKMITGFLAPTAGHIQVCGHNVETERLKAQSAIGYLPEGAPTYGDMTPRQFLNFIAEARGMHGAAARRAVDEAVAKTELQAVMDQQIETLSKGFTRRVGIAQAILHDPPVLIMDEPTDGLDPNQKFAVRNLIREMSSEKAIVISTHILEEVDAVCSRAMIIDRGRIVTDGKPADMIAQSRYHNAVTLVIAEHDVDAARKTFEGVSAIAGMQEERNDGTIEFTLFPEDPHHLLIEDVSAVLSNQKWDVRALYAEAGRLEQVFRQLTTADTEVIVEDDEAPVDNAPRTEGAAFE